MSSYRTQSPDTSEAAERVLIELWRKMEPWEKVERVVELTNMAREFSRNGLRRLYPQASEREIELRLASQSIDRETMLAAFGWAPPEEASKR